MPGKEFGPSDLVEQPMTYDERRAELIERIAHWKEQGEFFAEYALTLEDELERLDSENAAA